MSSALSFFARLNSLYRNGGIAELWRRFANRYLSAPERDYRRRKARDDAAFDALGYDTGGVQHLHDLTTVGANSASGGHHVAAPPSEFAAAMALIDLNPADLSFIDLGSGKGRALLLAADLPFRRIIGVEFAREMHEIALANFAKRAERLGPDPRIELLNDDATTYAFPDEPLLIFLFNPFDPPVLTRVAEHALAAWRARPREIRILYMNPIFADEWTRAGWRLLESRAGANLYGPPED